MTTSSSRLPLQPMRENNISNPNFTSDGKRSMGSNPFGGYSCVSVCSEDFQFNEDAAERLAREEMQISLAGTHSLSGVYADVGTSVKKRSAKVEAAPPAKPPSTAPPTPPAVAAPPRVRRVRGPPTKTGGTNGGRHERAAGPSKKTFVCPRCEKTYLSEKTARERLKMRFAPWEHGPPSGWR